MNALWTLQGSCRKSPFLWEGKLNKVLGERSQCQAWPKIAVIGLFCPSLVLARQLQGGSEQTHQWAGEMINYRRMAGPSDLLQGKHLECESTCTRAEPQWLKAYMVEVPVAPVGDGAHSLGTAGGTNHGMITVSRLAPAWGTNPQLSQLLKQMKTSQVTGLMSATALPSLHTDPRMPTPSPVGLCHVAPSLLQPWSPEQVPRGHTQSPGWDRGQDTAQPTEPSRQQRWHTRRKASLPIPAGCHTAAN